MKQTTYFLVAVFSMFATSSAFSAGFEKATLWSGRYAPIGAAATSVVNDSEATLFNPAGLAAASPGFSASVNFSPTFSQFKGPIVSNSVLKGESGFSPVYGVYGAYKLENGIGIGLGSSVVGGSKGIFKDVDLLGKDLKPTYETSIALLEHSLGVGYEPIEGLRIGAAWRVMQVSGDYETGSTSNSTVLDVRYNDFKATRWNGWRLGAQYAPKDSGWGVGLNFRSTVSFQAKSDSVTAKANGALTGNVTKTATAGTGSLATNFPMQLSLGGFKTVGDDGRKVILEYTFTRDALDALVRGANTVKFDGQIGGGAEALVNSKINTAGIPLNWKNQHNLRFGYDYTPSLGLAYRAGYILTSKVTPAVSGRVNLAPPALGHTFLVGAGYGLSQNLAVNLGVEYSMNNGDGVSAPDVLPAVAGKYSANIFAFHAGTSFKF